MTDPDRPDQLARIWPCHLSADDAALALRYRDRGRPLPASVPPMAIEHRRGLWEYRAMGFAGDCASAAMIQPVRLEDELARREVMDELRAEAREAQGKGDR
jgi:hypothetical protein